MTARREGVRARLARGYLERFPAEAAALLERAPVEAIARLLAADHDGQADAAFAHLTLDAAAAVLERLDDDPARRLLTALEPTSAAAMLAAIEEPARARLLACLPRSNADELRALMTYPPDTAGGRMDAQVATLRSEHTVADAIARLRARRRRGVQRLYLTDDAGRLVGGVGLDRLLSAEPETRLDTLSAGVPWNVEATAPIEEVVDELRRRQAIAVPVVDLDGKLVGALSQAAVIQAVEDEASVDVQTMVGASRQERALSPVPFAVRKRLPWLQINLLTAFLAASVVGLFESTIARFTALAVLLPVVAGQSGNTGAQALAVTMRGLTTREIRIRQWWRVASKEAQVAALNGLGVALTTCAGVYVWSRSVGLTLVIGLSMVISMVAAGLAGAVIPVLLTAVGQDPAQSSSIVLTTITDVVGFFSFLGIASLLASML